MEWSPAHTHTAEGELMLASEESRRVWYPVSLVSSCPFKPCVSWNSFESPVYPPGLTLPPLSVRPCLFLSLASSGSCQSILSQLYLGALIHLRPFSLQLKLGIRISCLYLKPLSPGFHLRPHSPSALTWLRVPLFPSWYVIPRFRQAPLAHPALPWPVVNLPPLWDSTPLPSPCLSIPLAPSMTFYPPTLPLSFATPTSTLSSGSLPLTWLHKPSVPPWPSRPVVSPWLHLSSASFGSLSP